MIEKILSVQVSNRGLLDQYASTKPTGILGHEKGRHGCYFCSSVSADMNF